MKRQWLDRTRLVALVGVLVLGGWVAQTHGERTPTPTPRPAGGKSLADVAKDKKLKGDTNDSAGGSIVISNENLSNYVAKGGLTTAKPGTQKTTNRGVHANPGAKVVDPATAPATERMLYWQGRYTAQLDRIATIKRQIQQLDYEIPGLWNDFFARDDPAYRDGVIKPRLDRSLERRDELAAQLKNEEPKLAQIKEDARKDGAEPGWFRGIKEPTPMPNKADKRPNDALDLTDRK